ncbi:MAG: hypothetical protein U1E78_09765 [Gammaproteobacteria bacterium]
MRSSSLGSSAAPADHFWKRVGQWSLLSFKLSLDVGANLLNLIPYGLLAPLYRKLYQKGWYGIADAIKLTSIPMTVMLMGGIVAVLSQLTLAVAVTSLFAPALIFGGLLRLPLRPYRGEWGVFIRRISEATTRGLLFGLAIGIGLGFASVYYPPLMFSPWIGGAIASSFAGIYALLRRSRAAWFETIVEIEEVELIEARIDYIQNHQFSENFRISLVALVKISKILGLQTLKVAEKPRSASVEELLERDYAEIDLKAEFDRLDRNYRNLWSALKSAAKEFDYFKKNKSNLGVLRRKFESVDEKAILALLAPKQSQLEISVDQYRSILRTQARQWFVRLLLQVPQYPEDQDALKRIIGMKELSSEVTQIGKKVAQRVREDFDLGIEPGYREQFALLLKVILKPDLVEQLKNASSLYRLEFVQEQKRIGELLIDETKSITSYGRLIHFFFKDPVGQFFFERFRNKEASQFPAFEHTQYFLRLITQCLNANPEAWPDLILIKNMNQQPKNLEQIRQQKHIAFAKLDETARPILARFLSDEALREEFDFSLELKILSLALNRDSRANLSDALIEFGEKQDRTALMQKSMEIEQALRIKYASKKFMQRCSHEYGDSRFRLIKPKLDLLVLTQVILSDSEKVEFFDAIDRPVMNVFYNALAEHIPEAPLLRDIREHVVRALKLNHPVVSERIHYYPQLRGIAEKYNRLYQGVINREVSKELNQEISLEILKEAIDFAYLHTMLSDPAFEGQFEDIQGAIKNSDTGLFFFGTTLYQRLIEKEMPPQVYLPMRSSSMESNVEVGTPESLSNPSTRLSI